MARQRDCLCLTAAVTLIQVIGARRARQARRTENVFLVGIVHYRGVHQRSAKAPACPAIIARPGLFRAVKSTVEAPKFFALRVVAGRRLRQEVITL